MNKKRKAQVQSVIKDIIVCADSLSSIREEEDDARDSIPENLEGSERYSYSEECSEAIDTAESSLRDIAQELEDSLS